jgi:aldehyde:ferredoxin oxidoreductase
MALQKGYAGKLLRVNLTNGSTATEELREDAAKLFIGGRGLGAKYLFDEVPAGADPLGEENRLYFITGPLADTPAQAASRWMAVTKSPLSGTVVRSTAGTDFGNELKKAGIDAVAVEGKAEKPTMIVINDDTVALKDATHLWGKGIDTKTLQETVRKELGNEKIQIACIGPAGENGTLFASILNGRRSASRGGAGTVMGSKNLKAIAVRGTKKTEVADKDKLNSITREIVSAVVNTDMFKGFSHLGTPGITALMHEMGMHPVKNFQTGKMEDFSGLTPDKLDEIFVKDEGCFRCFINCGSTFKVDKGAYKGDAVVGPEYETMWSFGANLFNTDLGFIVAANKVCDDYGIDTISAGVTIAFAMELYEKGFLSKDDLDGIDLTWGNHEEAYKLLMKIVKREGIGDILALGTKRAAEKIGKGAEQYAMQVKGLEMPAYEPRGAKGHGLNIATSTIGASHMTGYSIPELFGIPEQVDRFTTEGKGALMKSIQDKTAAYDSILLCGFPACFNWMSPEHYARLLVAATGIEEFSDVDYILKAGERTYNIEKAFNTREGFERKDDCLPERFIKEPVPDGPSKGQVFEMDILLDDYYKARGWDIETGLPTAGKMEELGLTAEAEELKKMGKLKV